MRKKRIPILDLVFLIIFGLLYWKPFVFNVSTSFGVAIPLEKKSFGIDVSHHQSKINWDTLFSNQKIQPRIDFVFIKATEGIDHVDNQLEYNLTNLENNKVPTGAYHFFSPNKSSVKQASHFLTHVNVKHLSLPPVLDVESESSTSNALVDSVKIWLESVENTSGIRPIIYCSWSYYKKYFSNDFEAYRFWVARYSNSINFSKHTKIIYWQFTDKAKLPLHNTKVDLNVSMIEFN